MNISQSHNNSFVHIAMPSPQDFPGVDEIVENVQKIKVFSTKKLFTNPDFCAIIDNVRLHSLCQTEFHMF